MKKLRIIIIACILLAVAAFFLLTAGTDAKSLIFERIEISDQHVALLVMLICGLTLLSTLTGLPILYLSMALGFQLGFTPALLICWGVNVVSVMASFYMVRRAFTDYFREKFGEKNLIRRLHQKIGKYGLWTQAEPRKEIQSAEKDPLRKLMRKCL